jgi:hypothetical protein
LTFVTPGQRDQLAPMDIGRPLRDVSCVQRTQWTNEASRRSLVLAAGLAGCLPAGNSPPGQHVVHDRSLSGVFFVASETAGVPSRVLATGTLRLPPSPCTLGHGELLADVFYFPVPEGGPATEGLAGEQPIIKDFLIQGGDVAKVTLATDRLGRPVYLTCPVSLSIRYVGLAAWRYNWTAQGASYLGSGSGKNGGPAFVLSPGRTRIFGDFLFDLNTGLTDLGPIDTSQGAFVREDFYYVSLTTSLNAGRTTFSLGRSKSDAAPELLLASTGPLGLATIEGDRTPQILVCMQSAAGPLWSAACGSGYAPFALLDTEKLTTSVLPFRPVQLAFVSASSDGHHLLFNFPDPNSQEQRVSDFSLLVLDWTTGTTARMDSSTFGGLPLSGAAEWRPGREELWFYFREIDAGYGLWKPESGAQAMAGIPVAMTAWPDGENSIFTRDGRYWFSWGNARRTVHVGPADDPAAPTFPIHPDGTVVTALWEVGDGRLLVGSSTTDPNRQDIAVVDPALRTSHTIASGGHAVALGRTRTLAIVNWESTRAAGDLALVELASGEQTILAENVYAAAVDPGYTADVPPEVDRLAPDTRVAFLTRSRLESPYDGLWVARLP